MPIDPAPPPLIAGPVALMRLVEVDAIGEVLEDMEALGLGTGDFSAETKFNGWLVQAAGGRLWSRRGKELTRKFPDIAAAVAPYTAEHLVGELVYWTPEGTMDEPTVTTVAGTADPREAAAKLRALPGRFEYVLFDAISLLGCDVSVLPTRERRELLLQAVEPFGPLRISDVRPFEDWSRVYDEAVAAGGDGVVLKNVHAPYVWRPLGQSEARPAGAWYKLKPAVTDDFVVVGLHPGPKGKLVVELAQYHRGRPVPVSEMSNLSRADERGFRQRLEEGPFVVEVEFQARFPDPPGALQHPRLVRIREDKRPEDATLPEKYALEGGAAMGVVFVSHHWLTPEGGLISLPIGVAHIADAIERGMESVLDALRRGWIRVIGRGVHWDFDTWDITDDRTLSTVEDFLSRILYERGGFRALVETQLPSWTTFSVWSDDLQGRSVREAVLDALRRERIFGR